MNKGHLFIISGPSGVGKGTIISQIINSEASKDIKLSISATTREPRKGEIEGESYFFLSEEEFKKKIKSGGFLEHAYVHGHYYGTPKLPVIEALEAGKDVILEIDVQGAMQVKKSFDKGIYIFILPPSMKQLKSRIIDRGTDAEDAIHLRMGKAIGEIEYLDNYDYYIVNDSLEQAIENIRTIITAEHFKTEGKVEKIISKFKEENK